MNIFYKMIFRILVLIFCFNCQNSYSAPLLTNILKTSDSTSSGYYLVGAPNSPLAILDIYGNFIQKEKLESLPNSGGDFKVHPNGMFSYYANNLEKHVVLDKDLNVIDTVASIGNYITDYHDFQIMSNGNYLLFGQDQRTMDLSQIAENGQPNTQVIGFEIQELDKKTKQVVFSWNTFDHINITDATEDIDFSKPLILYCHLNSILVDNDGNLILCFRHLDELIKINKTTGEIIWRMGGSKSKNNQFTFINDVNVKGFVGFSHQHDPIRLANGNILLFDNGNLKDPTYSRAVEYSINESSKTATKVWEYIKKDSMFSYAMSNAQRLENGNTLINWTQLITEVDSLGNIVQEFKIENDFAYRSYKAPVFMDYSKEYIKSNQNFNFVNTKFDTGIILECNNVPKSGWINVENHRISMQNPPIDTNSLVSKLLPVRLVFKSKEIKTYSARAKVSLSKLPSFSLTDSILVLSRDAETKGTFKKINYTINRGTSQLEFDINGNCEILIGIVKNLEIPMLIFPAFNQTNISNNPTLTWQNVLGATSYNVQLSNDNFKTILKEVNVNTNSATFNNLDYSSVYYWRVASKSIGKISAHSDIWNFKTKMIFPSLINPPNETKFFDIELDSLLWSKNPLATSYSIQMAENIGFSIGLYNFSNIKNNYYIPNNIQLGKKYYWRVKSDNSEGSSDWSEVYVLSTINEKPVLVSPQNNTINSYNKIKFVWQQKNTEDYYSIQVSTNSKFTNLVLNYTYIDTNTFEITKLLPSTTYYWRIKIDDSNKKSLWSDFWTFRTKLKTPVNYVPKNGEILEFNSITLEWSKIIDASSYSLEVSLNQDFKTLLNKEEIQNNTSFKISNLLESTTYYWRVQAKSSNNSSDYSNFSSFVTPTKMNLKQPILTFPQNDSKDLQEIIFFEWLKDSTLNKNKITYRIQIAKDNEFFNTIIDSSSEVENFYNEIPFENGTTYFWRIMTLEEGGYSKWSEIWSFSIRDIVDLSAPIIISPTNNFESQIDYIDFRWTSQKDIDNYVLQVARDNKFENLVFDLTTNSKSYRLSGLQKTLNYYWRVAFVLNNQQFWSELRSFTFKNDVNSIDFEISNNKVLFNISNEMNVCKITTSEEIKFIQLVDLLGNKITIDSNENLEGYNFEFSNLKSAVYFLIYQKDNKYYCKKFIYQN